jgi:predicted metal-dependent peptidase
MSCDGVSLRYQPLKIVETSADALNSYIASHVTQCVLGMPWRRRGRDKKLWRRSGELVASCLLKKDGMLIPDDMLYDPAFEDMSVEQVYKVLYERNPPRGGDQPGDDPGKGEPGDEPGEGGSKIEDAPPDAPEASDGEPPENTEFDWQIAAINAASMAAKAGNMGSGAQMTVQSANRVPIDWRTEMLRFIEAVARSDYDWGMPNKRYIAGGVYYPQLKNRKLGEVLIVVDVSGSTQHAAEKFCDNYRNIVEVCEPEKTSVLFWNTRFVKFERFEPGDPIRFDVEWGGGTVMEGVFEWITDPNRRAKQYRDIEINPCCCVFLTDGDVYGSMPKEPPFPVLFALTGHYAKHPEQLGGLNYGELLSLDDD